MVTQVERTHRHTQIPVSWGVAGVLVLALVAGLATAAIQVGGREVTRAALRAQQVETLARLNATETLQEEFRAQVELGLAAQALTLQQGAVDSALVAAYGRLQTQRAAVQQALRGEYGEIYESSAVAAAAVAQAEHQIEMLLAQRSVVPTTSSTYETQ